MPENRFSYTFLELADVKREPVRFDNESFSIERWDGSKWLSAGRFVSLGDLMRAGEASKEAIEAFGATYTQ